MGIYTIALPSVHHCEAVRTSFRLMDQLRVHMPLVPLKFSHKQRHSMTSIFGSSTVNEIFSQAAAKQSVN